MSFFSSCGEIVRSVAFIGHKLKVKLHEIMKKMALENASFAPEGLSWDTEWSGRSLMDYSQLCDIF